MLKALKTGVSTWFNYWKDEFNTSCLEEIFGLFVIIHALIIATIIGFVCLIVNVPIVALFLAIIFGIPTIAAFIIKNSNKD